MDATDPLERRCTARSKRSGVQCKRPPIQGGNVCVMHGGAAPQVKAAADARLRALVDPAIGALQDLIGKRNRHAPSRLGAAKDVLDRNGYKTPEQLDVNHTGRIEQIVRRIVDPQEPTE